VSALPCVLGGLCEKSYSHARFAQGRKGLREVRDAKKKIRTCKACVCAWFILTSPIPPGTPLPEQTGPVYQPWLWPYHTVSFTISFFTVSMSVFISVSIFIKSFII